MREELKKDIQYFAILGIIAIALIGIVNTLYLSNKIEELQNKIEVNKTFKSE